MLYLKITLRNIWRSKNENLIYILTILFCSSIFFAFNHLENLTYFSKDPVFIDLCIYLQPVFDNIKIISKVLGLPMIFLIIYIDRFLLKSRSKEYSIYYLLGIPTRIISLLMFVENFITGIVTVMIGCVVGNILSVILKCLLVSSMGFVLEVYWPAVIIFDPDIFISTLAFFGSQFLIVGIINIFVLSRLNFVNLINLSKKDCEYPISKGDLKKWNYILCVAFLLMLVSLYMCFNMLNFWLTCITSVICISLINVIYQWFLILLIDIKADLKQRWGIFNLKELVSSFSVRKKTYNIISLTALVSLCSIAACNILDRWGIVNISEAYVYDIQIPINYNSKSEIIKNEDKIKVEKFIDSKYCVSYGKMLHVFSTTIENRKTALLKISDFNNLQESIGKKKIKIKDNQILVYISPFRMSEDEIVYWDKMNGKSIEILGEKFSCIKVIEGTLGNGFLLPHSGAAIILPDNRLDNSIPVMSTLFFNIEKNMELDFNLELSAFIENLMKDQYNIDKSQINCQTVIERKATEKLGGLTVGLLAIYLGCCAAIICSVLLTIQNLSYILEQKRRYKILYLLGISKVQIKHKIWLFNLIHFGMPFVLAAVMQCIIISMWGFQNRLHVSRLYDGWEYFISGCTLPFLLIGIIMGAFFIFTSIWSVRKVVSYIEKG